MYRLLNTSEKDTHFSICGGYSNRLDMQESLDHCLTYDEEWISQSLHVSVGTAVKTCITSDPLQRLQLV